MNNSDAPVSASPVLDSQLPPLTFIWMLRMLWMLTMLVMLRKLRCGESWGCWRCWGSSSGPAFVASSFLSASSSMPLLLLKVLVISYMVLCYKSFILWPLYCISPVSGIEPRSSWVLGKHFTVELHSHPLLYFLC